MPPHPFEYAVIRVVPQVEREEFLNVGVIVYCKRAHFLGIKYALDEVRLLALHAQADVADIQAHLAAFQAIALGEDIASPIARMDAGERFRWLTAKRSTVLQTSNVHPGLCTVPPDTVNRLFQQLVAQAD